MDDEAEYGDYGGGPAFGQPDDSTPTDNDLDIPDDPEMDETSAENSDESKEQEPAKSDDATPGSADPPSSTSPTIPDPSGGAGAADPPPSSTPDSSKPAKTGSSSDDGKELGTTASPDDGQELGTTAPADDKKPAGNNGGGQWPSPNGGQGSGKPGGGKWASPTNPPPANNNDQYLPLDPAKDYKGPNRGNSGPSWNPWDPKRPGKKAGDVDVYLPAEFPDETYIDPDTGQKKTMSSAGVGIGVNLGGNSRPSSNSRPPEPTPGDVKYFDALDQAQNAAKPKAQDPDRNEQGGPTNDAATGGAPDRGAPGASTTNQMDQDRPPNGGSSNSQNGSMRVRVKPADALTDALTPDFVTKGMESAAQGAVDALERGVRWFYGSGSKPEQQAQEPQKSTPAPTSDEPAKPDRLSDEERARNRAATEAARKAAEPDWNAEQGAKFGKQYGPRPADPEQAKKWDRAKKDAIDSWIFEKQMQLESPVSEGGIRM